MVWVVLIKELRDGLRDRRSISTALFGAALTPILLGAMFSVMASRGKDADEIKLPVAGVENAPAFVDWLKQQTGVEIVAAPADPEQAVRDRKEDVVLILEKDFTKDLGRAVPAHVKLVSDSTRESGESKVERARKLVETYSGQLAALRLIARGVAPSVAMPVRIEDVEVSSAQERLAMRLNMLPLLLILAAMMGGMQVAIAATDADLMSLLALVLPLALFLSALVMFSSTFARSFKEAQGYMGMLVLLPMLPGILGALYPMSNRPWLAPVPILGQYALAADVLGGQPPPVFLYVIAGVSVVLCALGLLMLTSHLLEREAIIFGR